MSLVSANLIKNFIIVIVVLRALSYHYNHDILRVYSIKMYLNSIPAIEKAKICGFRPLSEE